MPAPAGNMMGVPPGETLRQEARRRLKTRPEMRESIKEAVATMVVGGMATPEQLNTLVQMAHVAADDPSMYPTTVEYFNQLGIGEPESPEYDPEKVIEDLMFAEIAGPMVAARTPPQKGTHTVDVHEGEYVIPTDVVKRKGTEFFEKLLQPPKAGGGGASS